MAAHDEEARLAALRAALPPLEPADDDLDAVLVWALRSLHCHAARTRRWVLGGAVDGLAPNAPQPAVLTAVAAEEHRRGRLLRAAGDGAAAKRVLHQAVVAFDATAVAHAPSLVRSNGAPIPADPDGTLYVTIPPPPARSASVR